MINENARNAGIWLLYNIWNKELHQFFMYNQIQIIYGENAISFLNYHALISAIPRSWINQLRNARHVMEDFLFPYETFEGKTMKNTYERLVTNKGSIVQLANKWNTKLENHITWEEMSLAFENISNLVVDTKMRNFQF